MKRQKSSVLEKLKLFLCIIIVPLIIYFVAISLRDERLKEIEFIKTDFEITHGVITSKTVYKGKSIRVKYIIENKTYRESDGFDDKYKIEIGDSVKLKYSKTKPELMITEFNEDY